jgi:hypothetical protein
MIDFYLKPLYFKDTYLVRLGCFSEFFLSE